MRRIFAEAISCLSDKPCITVGARLMVVFVELTELKEVDISCVFLSTGITDNNCGPYFECYGSLDEYLKRKVVTALWSEL